MLVERIWTGNSYRNFNYLIACPETGEALAIDPLDSEKTLHTAKVKGWQITQILNTHEHHDHTGGNAAVVAATGAKVIAHAKAGGAIVGMDRGVQAGDHQGGQNGGAGMPGHPRPHDVPHLPALTHRAARAVLGRHAV
jgi:hydroxyacylglutathione hydrolase